jgi:G:T/U-mismatch repair DNA glycosylase
MENKELEIESHPWQPFIPDGAKVLIMGTFPPQAKRWSMDFYYPNRTNDFWKICGLLFLGDKDALLSDDRKTYDIDKIRSLMTEKRIALNDTVRKARRLKGNASDKFLEVIEPVPLFGLLSEMPGCHAVATTGEKAAGIVAALTGTDIPRMGEMTLAAVPPPDASESPGQLEIWRMPSTSRAYPLAVELKAEYYATLFRHLGIL